MKTIEQKTIEVIANESGKELAEKFMAWVSPAMVDVIQLHATAQILAALQEFAQQRDQEHAEQVAEWTARFSRCGEMLCDPIGGDFQQIEEAVRDVVIELEGARIEKAETDKLNAEQVNGLVDQRNKYILEVEQAREDVRRLKVELATAHDDAKRLDWLETKREGVMACFGKPPAMGSGLPYPFEGFVLSSDPRGEAKPLRTAIDAAMTATTKEAE